MLISELASARVADGVSILTLLNSTQLISGKLHTLQMNFLQVCDALESSQNMVLRLDIFATKIHQVYILDF